MRVSILMPRIFAWRILDTFTVVCPVARTRSLLLLPFSSSTASNSTIRCFAIFKPLQVIIRIGLQQSPVLPNGREREANDSPNDGFDVEMDRWISPNLIGNKTDVGISNVNHFNKVRRNEKIQGKRHDEHPSDDFDVPSMRKSERGSPSRNIFGNASHDQKHDAVNDAHKHR